MKVSIRVIIFLLLSATTGIILLLTDAEVWDTAPSHAYALLVLILADIILIVMMKRSDGEFIWKNIISKKYNGKLNNIHQITAIWGIIKVCLFLGDILTAPQLGQTYHEFAKYLFSVWTFNALIIIQIMIVITSMLELRNQKN